MMSAYSLEEIPNAGAYLCEHADELQKRTYLVESKAREWYECWVPQKLSKFRQTKIVTRDIVAENSFALDEEGRLCQGNTFFLTPKDSLFTVEYKDMSEHEYFCFILGLLNSRALEYYQKMISGCLYSQKYRYTSTNLNRWPVPGVPVDTAKRIAVYVEELLKGTENNSYLEACIDSLIFEAFALSEEEINQVNSFIRRESI